MSTKLTLRQPNSPFVLKNIFGDEVAGHGSAILTIAVHHLRLFDKLKGKSYMKVETIAKKLEVTFDAAMVICYYLFARGYMEGANGNFKIHAWASELLESEVEHSFAPYLALDAESPLVLELLEIFRSGENASERAGECAGYCYGGERQSPMADSGVARVLTEAMAARAKSVAPVFAQKFHTIDEFVDVGGSHGLYSYALLQRFTQARATIFDHPNVLPIAREYAELCGVADRVTYVEGDVFAGGIPQTGQIILSNVLHDWGISECQTILRNCRDALNQGGRVYIHDVFLGSPDDREGHLAAYGAKLMRFSHGRSYTFGEYCDMLTRSGLKVIDEAAAQTLIHAGILRGGR